MSPIPLFIGCVVLYILSQLIFHGTLPERVVCSAAFDAAAFILFFIGIAVALKKP